MYVQTCFQDRKILLILLHQVERYLQGTPTLKAEKVTLF